MGAIPDMNSKAASLALLAACMVSMAPGPIFGVWAMARLRAHPDALRLAGGMR